MYGAFHKKDLSASAMGHFNSYCCDHYPGTLSIWLSHRYILCEDREPVDEIFMLSIISYNNLNQMQCTSSVAQMMDTSGLFY